MLLEFHARIIMLFATECFRGDYLHIICVMIYAILWTLLNPEKYMGGSSMFGQVLYQLLSTDSLNPVDSLEILTNQTNAINYSYIHQDENKLVKRS